MAISILIAYAINQGIQATSMGKWSWLVEVPSAFAIFGFLNWKLYGEFLWRFPCMRWFGIVEFPDLRGRWEGTLVSTHDHKSIPCVFEIEQSAYDIFLCAYFERSTSCSITAGFATINRREYLYVTYDNEIGALSEQTMQNHRGTMRLYLLPDKQLKGLYFNSRGNTGEVKVKRTDMNLRRNYQ